MSLSRFTCPSNCPLLHSSASAARIAERSLSIPSAKLTNSGIPLPRQANTGCRTNRFFRELYSDVAGHAKGLEARELTAQVKYELRTSAEDAVSYMAVAPRALRTDRVSNLLMELEPSGKGAIEWVEKSKDKVPK